MSTLKPEKFTADRIVPPEYSKDVIRFEFNTQAELDAFFTGVCAGAGYESSEVRFLDPTSNDDRERFEALLQEQTLEQLRNNSALAEEFHGQGEEEALSDDTDTVESVREYFLVNLHEGGDSLGVISTLLKSPSVMLPKTVCAEWGKREEWMQREIDEAVARMEARRRTEIQQ